MSQERYLWCRVWDGDFGFKQLAGEGGRRDGHPERVMATAMA